MTGERKLFCSECGALVMLLRDAKVLKSAVVYCGRCAIGLKAHANARSKAPDMPDFMQQLFGKKS